MQAGPTELTAKSAACGSRFFRRGDDDSDSDSDSDGGVVTGACGRHERARPNSIRVGHRPLGEGPPVCVQSARSVPACGMAADNRSRLLAMCAGFCVAGACRPRTWCPLLCNHEHRPTASASGHTAVPPARSASKADPSETRAIVRPVRLRTTTGETYRATLRNNGAMSW